MAIINKGNPVPEKSVLHGEVQKFNPRYL